MSIDSENPAGESNRTFTVDDLIYLGFNSNVVALNRQDGTLVWKWKSPKGTGFVSVLVDGDCLIVSIQGYTYCLDALSGQQYWFNPLKGLGTGVTCIATSRSGTLGFNLLQAAQQQMQAQAAAHGGAAAGV